ncbi:glycosyltransferase family 2 protein [Chachezhania antarctica]|uniref:glycosyltransferase family 2 protein n=1 Tax=Chachezhania antarctica TaxID=2340860 RepID=UPI000EB19B5C|nr:glycosyltransferase family A protein [Chachezhania antarctica]|tara:strand:- start:420 stop:1337 length:918 start_codon:yes stop_codon:yes gene_type:complete
MPLFSIIVPCYNAAATLECTLASLTAQTCTDWEMLCIDDGSTDATPDILAAAAEADPRIRVLENIGKGPSHARNRALAEATGEFLAFCDADDLWAPRKLTRMADALLSNQTLDGIYARVAFFDGVHSKRISCPPTTDLTIPMLLGENPVCTMSNLTIRREAFLETGGFDTRMVHNEDLEWLIRTVGHGFRLRSVDDCLVQYRTSTTGLSSNLAAMRKGREQALQTAARYGFHTDARSEAIHLRYLARRALRVGAPGTEALRLALSGLAASPRGFFSNMRRGGLTVLGAVLAPVMPAFLRRSLFAG